MNYTLKLKVKHAQDLVAFATLSRMLNMNRKLRKATVDELIFDLETFPAMCDPIQSFDLLIEVVSAATSIFYAEDENGVPSPIFQQGAGFLQIVHDLGQAMRELGELMEGVASDKLAALEKANATA